MRPSYGLEITYDGTPFFGWQSQPHGNTVQDHIERALAEALGLRVRLVPASRTDTGVHAEQQFAIFRSRDTLSWSDDVIPLINANLPETIKIKSTFTPSMGFHPRVHAQAKVYCYRLYRDPSPSSHLVPGSWRLYRSIDVDTLRLDLASLVGTHDFSSFCASGSSIKTKVRTISRIEVVEDGPGIALWFEGDGFLKQMIRIIVGSAVAYACRHPGAEPLHAILSRRDRLAAGKTAPAQGLTLHQIIY